MSTSENSGEMPYNNAMRATHVPVRLVLRAEMWG